MNWYEKTNLQVLPFTKNKLLFQFIFRPDESSFHIDCTPRSDYAIQEIKWFHDGKKIEPSDKARLEKYFFKDEFF